MPDHEKNHENQCWTRHRKDGSRYVICGDSDGATGVAMPRQSPTHDSCTGIKDPLARDACRTMSELPGRMRQAQEDWIARQPERFRQPSDTSKPPVYGWEKVDRNIEATLRESWPAWVDRVRENGEWDFKARKPPLPGSNKIPPWAERERAGNINYGATCVAAGHDPETCLRAGGAVQGLSDAKNRHVPFHKSSGRPWDTDADSCRGEPTDDCQQVIEGIRYGLDYLRRRGR